MSLHFYELDKIPLENAEENMLLLWLSLFNASTKDDLAKIKELEVPEMNQAIDAYYRITADSKLMETIRMLEKARHDEAQALYDARQEGEKISDQKWQNIVAEKEAKIAEKEAAWQDIVADKDAVIASLQAALEEKQ